MITVIGLGVKTGDLTKEGEEAILKTAATGGKILVHGENAVVRKRERAERAARNAGFRIR